MKFIKKILAFFITPKPKIAHVNLSGVIGKDSRFDKGLNFENVFEILQDAFKLDGAKAVAISINSPGGSPVQSELIFNAIRELSADKKIPVFTFAHDVAASGGYWLLLAGDEIYAHNSSIIGSIGVIFSGFGFVDLIKKIGVERRIYTEGKNKAILDPFMPEEKENIAILKEAQKDIFENFKELVWQKRVGKLRDENGAVLEENSAFLNDKIFTGAFWSGRRAAKLGLVDGVADLRGKMKEKFGDDIKIVEIEAKKGFLKSLISGKFGAATSAANVKAVANEIEERVGFGRFGL